MSEFKTDKIQAMISTYTCTGNLPNVLHVKENYQCIKYINDVFFVIPARHRIREEANVLRILRKSKTFSLTTFCEFTSRALQQQSTCCDVKSNHVLSSSALHAY